MRILCATDLLPKSEAAIERAGLLSNQLRSRPFTLARRIARGVAAGSGGDAAKRACAHQIPRGAYALAREPCGKCSGARGQPCAHHPRNGCAVEGAAPGSGPTSQTSAAGCVGRNDCGEGARDEELPSARGSR